MSWHHHQLLCGCPETLPADNIGDRCALPPSLPRPPLLLHSCSTRSVPYSSFLLPLNFATRSGEARQASDSAHTHTHPFNGPFSGTTRVSRYQKGKTNLDFTEARDSEWQWHQLGHMQVCTLLQTDNHASTHCSVFTGRMPFLPPNQQRQSTEGTSFRQCLAKKLQPVARVGGDQMQLVPVISEVGEDASHRSHGAVAPMPAWPECRSHSMHCPIATTT